MKLSAETIAVIKYFSGLNQGIFFKQGNVVRTMSPDKNVVAEATISEDLPLDFGIYDLGVLLGALSLFSDGFEVDFGPKKLEITGLSGKSKTTYTYTDPTMIVQPPDKMPSITGREVNFVLSEEDLAWVQNAASVLKSPQIVIESDGSKIYLSTADVQNNAANVNRTEIGPGNGDEYRFIFKKDLFKLMADTYDVKANEKRAQFIGKSGKLKVLIGTEIGSKFK